MAVARHFGPCSPPLPKSCPKTQLVAVPSSLVGVSSANVYQLLVWLPHAHFCFLLYFSSWFYLNCVTVSKWLCFIPHKLSTYSYYLFFPVCLPGITHPGWSSLLPAAPLNSECRDRGGGPRLAPPPVHVYNSNLKHQFLRFVLRQNQISAIKYSLPASHILLITASFSSPLWSQFSICFFKPSYRHRFCSHFLMWVLKYPP